MMNQLRSYFIFSESWSGRTTDGNIVSCGISLVGSTKGIADFMADKIMIMSRRMENGPLWVSWVSGPSGQQGYK